MITFNILTIFPGMFEGVFQESLLKRAQEEGLLEINLINIRDYSTDKHNRVDDYPYGGGPGMVMKPGPVFRAFADINENADSTPHSIFMSPQGKTFDQQKAIQLTEHKEITILCGRYEGIDARIREELIDEELSIGDYVLTGGELPAMVVVDAIARMIPGVLGDTDSIKEDSFYQGILGYPQYTRPSNFEGEEVPQVLMSGNHAKIDEWRRKEALRLTHLRRPELLKEADLTEQDRELLEQIKEEK